MKKNFLIAILFLHFSVMFAQKDVTKFMGIPVDGTKSEMIRKLKAKGFTVDPYKKDMLTGEFNGQNVNVFVGTNNNRVCRIMVADAKCVSETDIKIRFNNLCAQFENNERYISGYDVKQTIPDDEDISYKMSVYKKRYEAVFFQKPENFQEDLMSYLKSKYTDEQISDMTENVQEAQLEYLKRSVASKTVWFMIGEVYGQYCIYMYYDNKYNEANGEDL